MATPPAFAATILAAGAGRRLGNRPKATLRIGECSLLERLTVALREAGIADLSIVIGPYQEQLLPLAARCDLHVLAHPQPEHSLVASQRRALAAHVERHAGADLLLVLADLPLLTAAHIRPLLQAWQQCPDTAHASMPWVNTAHGQVRGHPVLLSWQAVRHIAAAPAGFGIRDWLAAHPDAVHPVCCSDPAYVTDVDTPEDLARLREIVHPEPVDWPAPESRG